jgi:hypothetical protein
MRILRVVDTVMGACRIEVAAGSSEGWHFAFSNRVDVNAMLAGS